MLLQNLNVCHHDPIEGLVGFEIQHSCFIYPPVLVFVPDDPHSVLGGLMCLRNHNDLGQLEVEVVSRLVTRNHSSKI